MERTTPTLRRLHGASLSPYLEAVVALRIAVFRDWPYLYEGDVGYEREYLGAYLASPRSVVVLAMVDDAVVGASTGVPLDEESPAFRAPFEARGIDPATVFYFGESVLLPAWRGLGVGHAFFDHREDHARTLGGIALTAFAAVDRDAGDPRRPEGHRGNEAFWAGRGYVRQPGMTMTLPWNELDVGEVDHALTFWTRPLPTASR